MVVDQDSLLITFIMDSVGRKDPPRTSLTLRIRMVRLTGASSPLRPEPSPHATQPVSASDHGVDRVRLRARLPEDGLSRSTCEEE